MEFKDFFSKQAKEYSKHRPHYPGELFKYLSSLTTEHNLCWDSACGNGQASLGLAEYYRKVIATDASRTQIENALPHPKIEYLIAPAENSGLNPETADLITVATAIHWLDTEKFYNEVRRILKPGGIIAVWGYSHSHIEPEIDRIIKVFANKTIDAYWPGDNVKAWNFETSIHFPFERIKTPEFNMTAIWTLEKYMDYLNTWSSVQRYIDANKSNPMEILRKKLLRVWGDEKSPRKISWKLDMKVGRV